jgi:hypothetical protein
VGGGDVVSEPLDLEPIKARYVESEDAVDWTFDDPWDVIADVPFLVAEIERLRGQVQELRMDLSNAAYDADRSSKWERR